MNSDKIWPKCFGYNVGMDQYVVNTDKRRDTETSECRYMKYQLCYQIIGPEQYTLCYKDTLISSHYYTNT